jgi:hypothetical protein
MKALHTISEKAASGAASIGYVRRLEARGR